MGFFGKLLKGVEKVGEYMAGKDENDGKWRKS